MWALNTTQKHMMPKHREWPKLPVFIL